MKKELEKELALLEKALKDWKRLNWKNYIINLFLSETQIYTDYGFCKYFNWISNHTFIKLPKHLKLAYIGSKYFIKELLYDGYWFDSIEYSQKPHKVKRIELLKAAIKLIKIQIKYEKSNHTY